ncbi:hypothetical protein Tcan_16317 [Toxocara canis]|uniref:Uncharacterized protein n=1 Tax=Toxocara canis TaxID=6265 RepID=A0A0B2VY48_TOXCA|nr:hypothetical protein Tcan_16317 [Toxocara canis]
MFPGLKKLYTAGGMAVVMSTVFMTIERLVATCLYKTYQRRSHKWMGIALSLLLCTLDDGHLRVQGTRYQLNENINTTRLMIPIVTINAALVLSYSAAYAFFFPSLNQNTNITKELHNSINEYAPVAEFLCTLDDGHLRVQGTRYQLNENINTTRLMIPIVTINAALVLSYSAAYAFFFPSLNQNTNITKELHNSINEYAPVAEFLVGWLGFFSAEGEINGLGVKICCSAQQKWQCLEMGRRPSRLQIPFSVRCGSSFSSTAVMHI